MSLLRKMTCKDKGSYASSPLCTAASHCFIALVFCIPISVDTSCTPMNASITISRQRKCRHLPATRCRELQYDVYTLLYIVQPVMATITISRQQKCVELDFPPPKIRVDLAHLEKIVVNRVDSDRGWRWVARGCFGKLPPLAARPESRTQLCHSVTIALNETAASVRG